jgi:hypothetical protein
MKSGETISNDLFGTAIGLSHWCAITFGGDVQGGVIEPLHGEGASGAQDVDSVGEHGLVSGRTRGEKSHESMLTRQQRESVPLLLLRPLGRCAEID